MKSLKELLEIYEEKAKSYPEIYRDSYIRGVLESAYQRLYVEYQTLKNRKK